MKTIYKVFLVLFIVFIAINAYAIDYKLGLMHEENSKYLFSFAAGVAGLLVVFVMDSWSKLSVKK